MEPAAAPILEVAKAAGSRRAGRTCVCQPLQPVRRARGRRERERLRRRNRLLRRARHQDVLDVPAWRAMPVLERLGRWDEAGGAGRGLARGGALAGEPAQPAGEPRPGARTTWRRRRLGVSGRGDDAGRRCREPSGSCSPNRPSRGVLAGRPSGRRRANSSGRRGAPPRAAPCVSAWQPGVVVSPGGHAAAATCEEPWASEVSGDVERATRLWDQLGFRYAAAMALLGSDDDADLRQALVRLEALGATLSLGSPAR